MAHTGMPLFARGVRFRRSGSIPIRTYLCRMEQEAKRGGGEQDGGSRGRRQQQAGRHGGGLLRAFPYIAQREAAGLLAVTAARQAEQRGRRGRQSGAAERPEAEQNGRP